MSPRHRMTRQQTRRCAAVCFSMIAAILVAPFLLGLAAGRADCILKNPYYLFLFLLVFFGILFGSGARRRTGEEDEEDEE